MTDTATIAGSPAVQANTINPIAAANTLIGSVVQITSGEAALARANALATSHAVGVTTAAGHAGGRVRTQFAGVVVLTAAEWDAAQGTEGGLTPNQNYWLSSGTAGRFQTTAPASPNYVAPIGFAVSATELMLTRGVPIVGV